MLRTGRPGNREWKIENGKAMGADRLKITKR
jgi:hypothetical protein